MKNISKADFEILFKQHHEELCNLAYTITKNEDAAKDIVQDVFIKLWKNKDEIVFQDQIKHYLFRAVSHSSLNYIRFNKKIVSLPTQETFSNLFIAPVDNENIEFTELERRVHESIEKLPPKCKAIYLLSRHEGLKYREIADALGLSIKTVENQMGIALEKLRDDLRPFLSAEFLIVALFIALAYYFIIT